MTFNFLKTLDADDIFISYSREDGSAYLTGLDAALSARGFSCFTDKRGTDAGRLPPETLFRKIRLCKTLVLLATPGALAEPENIAPEVSEFAEANGTSRIVCVSFDRDAEFADWSQAPWFAQVEGKAREREDPNALKTGEPSPAVVEAVVVASDYMKSKDRLRRYRKRALWVLAWLVVAIVAAALLAGFMFKRAEAATRTANEETNRAERATRDAQAALSQAVGAQGQALTAELIAALSKADADEQKRLAQIASDEAAEKTRLADAATRKADAAETRAATEQARADREQAVADARAKANESETLLRQHPEEVHASLSGAVAAMQKSLDARSHILEADSALRDSLALLPHLRNSFRYAGHVDHASALSPDGRYFALLSADAATPGDAAASPKNRLRIYDSFGRGPLKDRKWLREIECDCSKVALSSGLAYAAALTGDGIQIIDLNDPARGSHLVKLDKGVSPDGFALSPGGRYLALYFDEGEVTKRLQVLEAVNSESAGSESASSKFVNSKFVNSESFIFDDLKMKIHDIAFGPTGSLAVGGEQTDKRRGRRVGRVVIWSLPLQTSGDGREPKLSDASFRDPEIIPQLRAVNAVAPGPDGASFATDTGIWKRTPGGAGYEPVARLPYRRDFDSSSYIKSIAFAPDGRTLTLTRSIDATDRNQNGSDEEVLEVWDTNGHTDAARKFAPEEVERVGFKEGGHLFAVVTKKSPEDKKGREVGMEFSMAGEGQGREIPSRTGPGEKTLQDFEPTEGYVVNTDGTVALVHDLWGRGKPLTAAFGDLLESVDVAAVSPGGKFLALAGPNKGGGKSIVVGSADGSAYGNWKIIPQNEKELGDLGVMSLSADGQRLAVSYSPAEEIVRVWDLSDGRPRDISPHSLRKISDLSLRMRLSPGGRFLLLTDLGNQTRLLDLSNGKQEKLLDNTFIRSRAFSRDDRYLGIGSDEGILYVFDTQLVFKTKHASDKKSPEAAPPVARLQLAGSVTAVAFGDDDKYVLTASSDPPWPERPGEEETHPLRVWLLQPSDLMEEAEHRIDSLSHPTDRLTSGLK